MMLIDSEDLLVALFGFVESPCTMVHHTFVKKRFKGRSGTILTMALKLFLAPSLSSIHRDHLDEVSWIHGSVFKV
jgi:hypothetical protein